MLRLKPSNRVRALVAAAAQLHPHLVIRLERVCVTCAPESREHHTPHTQHANHPLEDDDVSTVKVRPYRETTQTRISEKVE